MKKALCLTIILLIIMGIFSGCDVYSGRRPYDYGAATWVCSEPYMEYCVTEYTYGGSVEYTDFIDVLKIENSDEEYEILFSYGDAAYIWKKYGNSYETDCLLTGSCRFSGKRFKIIVDKESDKLFDGKYDQLVFVRKEPANQ